MGTNKKSKTQDAGEVPIVREVPVSEAFRETFLLVLDAEEAQAFRRFGDVIQDRLLDRSTYEERNPQYSFTLAEMFGVAADLCFLEGFLRTVGSERRVSDLTPTEQGLSLFAEQLAPEVAALADRLNREIERLISDEEDQEPEAAPADGE